MTRRALSIQFRPDDALAICYYAQHSGAGHHRSAARRWKDHAQRPAHPRTRQSTDTRLYGSDRPIANVVAARLHVASGLTGLSYRNLPSLPNPDTPLTSSWTRS